MILENAEAARRMIEKNGSDSGEAESPERPRAYAIFMYRNRETPVSPSRDLFMAAYDAIDIPNFFRNSEVSERYLLWSGRSGPTAQGRKFCEAMKNLEETKRAIAGKDSVS